MKVKWNGITYWTIQEAADANYVSYDAMRRRLKKGWTCDEDMYRHKRKRPKDRIRPTWNGVQYDSLEEGARALGITRSALSARLRKGYTCDDDLTNPASPRQGVIK